MDTPQTPRHDTPGVPLAALAPEELGMWTSLNTRGFPQAHFEETGGGVMVLLIPLPNGAVIDWKWDGGWVYGVQDAAGAWLELELGTGAVRPSRVLAKTRALAARYS